jgi:CBS domain-containing protein
MLVSQILKTKGDMVFTIGPSDSVRAATAMLLERRVGALVVLDAQDHVVGILSERDVVRIVAEHGGDGLARPVSSCMTQDVSFADPGDTVDGLMARMTDRRFRHLPVCRGETLVGLVSIGDLVKAKIAEAEAEADGLKAYIAGT